jgi:hypothetical protein
MGYDISNVVACEILGAPCNRQSKSVELGGNLSMPIKLNVREDEKNLNIKKQKKGEGEAFKFLVMADAIICLKAVTSMVLL